jgi:hypothetical protein
MTRTPLAAAALLILMGCSPVANIKSTPLKDQSADQVATDRRQCEEWSKKTAAPPAGFAACLVASSYETTPQVGSTSQTIRLTRTVTETDSTRVLLDVLDCDAQARREAERDLGFISRWIKENLYYWRTNTEKRRQVFDECIKPRGYDLGKS